MYIFFSELESKNGLLRELVPQAVVIAALVNPSHPTAKNQATELRAAAHNFGQQILIISASNERELDTAFASMRNHKSVHCSSPPIPFSTPGVKKLFRLRHDMPFLPFMSNARSRQQAV